VRKLIIALIGLAILWSVLYFSGFTEAFMYGFEGHAGLPSCDSSHGRSDAKSVLENAPFAKTLHINIVAITEAKMTSGNAEKVECQATVGGFKFERKHHLTTLERMVRWQEIAYD
jgi:hypothetical protein